MKISNKEILITGGSGFIGSWLCSELIKDNEIIVYDNKRRDALKFSNVHNHKNLTYISGDILNRDFLKKSIPRKIDIVFHLAAIAGVSSYYEMPLETMKVNLIGTYNLLEALKEKNIGLFMDFSTSEVYGSRAKYVKEEDNTCQGNISDMRWTYAISKLAAEKLCHCYQLEYDIPVISIRPFNIYGPRQIGEGAIQIFISKAIKDEDIIIHGDGVQVRAWCYIEDFIRGVISCVIKRKVSIGNVFNLGNPGAAVSISDLAREIIELSNSKSKTCFQNSPRTDIEYRIPDISRARKMLGFSPEVGLTEGLKRTIKWYRKNLI